MERRAGVQRLWTLSLVAVLLQLGTAMAGGWRGAGDGMPGPLRELGVIGVTAAPEVGRSLAPRRGARRRLAQAAPEGTGGGDVVDEGQNLGEGEIAGAASNGTVVVQVDVEVLRLVAADLRLGAQLQRQKPDGTTWAPWSTALEHTLSLRNTALAPRTMHTLSDVERRAAGGAEVPITVTVSFNQHFRALIPGVYRVAVVDRTLCTPTGNCAVLGYSTPQTLPGAEDGRMTTFAALSLRYGAIELGLQFTSCANGSACISPARGVLVSVAVTDAEGDVYDPRKQLINKAVRVNSQGYAILGAFLGVERTLQFSPRPGSLSPMRPDVSITASDSAMIKSIGVLDLPDSQLLCAPSPSGQTYHEFLVSDEANGVVPRVMQDPSKLFYTPGLQCFWMIAPSGPVGSIQMQFTQMGRGLGQGSSVKIYTLSSSRRAQGPVPKLVRSVQGLTQETLEVAGSRVMLHFSAAEYSAIGNGFQMLWTAVPKEDSSSWFDTRTATIVFSCLAGAAYTIAAIAAWKWYRQRVERQAEEARRAAAREEQRNLRRRHRQEGHRRRRARGLPLELVSRLPTSSIKLSELEPDAGGEEPMCTICLCEYEEGEKVTWLPCSHSYHTECVTSWLKSSLTCPICKDNVKRSLLKTLSMYRELHRGGGLPADLEGGTGTDTDDYGSGRLGVASGSASAQPPAIEMSALHLEVPHGDDSSRMPSETGD
eukprot:jgi/Tetstr1/448043/TSEL_035343.t1